MTAENSTPFTKDPLQDQAIALGCGTNSRIVGITGPAGTGKTTIMKQIYRRFVDAGYTVALAAPTGKAAKRISEATGIEASTLHRLLEFTHPGEPDPKTGKPYGASFPQRKPSHPLAQDVILVDEYSMANTQLDRDILDAMKAGSLIRIFGDVNQLPPIEENKLLQKEPSPFERHLKNFPSVTLKNIYRQGEGSGIVKNGARILNKMCPAPFADFKLIIGKNPVTSVEDIVMAGDADYASIDHQIITPTNIRWTGTNELNKRIQGLLHGDALHLGHVMPRHEWDKKYPLKIVEGDKVIWKKNDYNLNIYNGETGIVRSLERDMIVIDFGDREVAVPPWIEYLDPKSGLFKRYDPRVNLYLAYALTTHSCQGSEYGHIVYVMDTSSTYLQNRSNFYTAITRARTHATVISDQRSFQKAVMTDYQR